jgi:hypothetical protein
MAGLGVAFVPVLNHMHTGLSGRPGLTFSARRGPGSTWTAVPGATGLGGTLKRGRPSGANERTIEYSYERTDSRVNERNGSRPRILATQAGDIDLRIPKLRKRSFVPLILEPRRRIDQALHAVVMEVHVAGGVHPSCR